MSKTYVVVKDRRRYLLNSTPKTIESLIRDGLTLTGKYCVQDTILPIELTEKLNLWTTMEEMSNVMHIPPSYLHTRGQQIKVLAQVYRETIYNDIIIPYSENKKNEKYQGATVFKAIPGYYINVGVLDFASLYPTTIDAFNICYTTILEDDDPTPDSECHVLRWSSHIGCIHDPQKRKKKKEDVLCADHYYRFRRVKFILRKDETVEIKNDGIFPRLERNLLTERKAVKVEMAKAEAKLKMHKGDATDDDIEYYKKCKWEIIEKGSLGKKQAEMLGVVAGVLDAKQKALKVSANSVGGNTPIPCLVDGRFEYLKIEDLWNYDKHDVDKDGNQVCIPQPNILVWSDKGFTKPRYVIRHKIKNPLLRINTHTGIVDCTPEHSLLYPSGDAVCPKDLEVGDELMHMTPPLPKDTPETPKNLSINNKTINSHYSRMINNDEKQAWVHGLFFAEGTCGSYGALETANNSWCIYNKDYSLLEKARLILNKIEKCSFYIFDYGIAESTLPSGKRHKYHIYHLKPKSEGIYGGVKKLVGKYRQMMYDNRKTKKLPSYVLSSSYRIRRAFLMGYYAGDGNRHLKRGVVITNKGQIGTAGLFYLAQSLGYKVSVSYSKTHNKGNIFRLQLSTKFRKFGAEEIKTIEKAPLPPPISKTSKDVIRNGVKLEEKNGVYIYKNIEIRAKRMPRQKLIDSLDEAEKKIRGRGNLIGYDTSTKKITYKCASCSKETIILLYVAHMGKSPAPGMVCKCKEEKRWKKHISNEIVDDGEEYIYDIETESHHFAAGVGSMIVHNSMYGIMGAKGGYIPFIPGAASVTAMGRKLIVMAIDRIEKEFPNTKLVYGDSVTGDTPILCRLGEDIFIRPISDLPKGWWVCFEGYEKETSYPKKGLEVWTERGFTPIKKIIRHKTSKRIYRITTHTGVVKVTEDHSLLDTKGKKISPKDVDVGFNLLTSSLPDIGGDDIIPDAWVWGLFYGDGSCGSYTCPSGKKNSWAINNQNIEFLNKAKTILTKTYHNYDFKILDTMKSSSVYKLVAKGDIVRWVSRWREMFYDPQTRFKKIPDQLWKSTFNSRKDFFNGYYAADGDKDIRGYTRFSNKGQIGSMGLYLLASSLEYNISVNTRSDKLEIYRLTLTKNKQRKHPGVIKKIEDLGKNKEEYVYDLETENHHFAGGVGQLVLHNTDSCMLIFKGCNLLESFDLGKKAGVVATHYLKCYIMGVDENFTVTSSKGKHKLNEIGSNLKKFKHFASLSKNNKLKVYEYESIPIDLEFENMYGRFLLLTKKRYVAYIVNKDGKIITIQKKGVVLARRDNSQYLRDGYTEMIKAVLDEKSERDVMDILYRRVNDLFTRKVPDTHLIIYMGVKNVIAYAEKKEVKNSGGRVVGVLYLDSNKDPIIDERGNPDNIKNPLDPRLVYKNLPQTLLSLKLLRRGVDVPPNTRLEFLYLENPDAIHQGDKAEDYTYYKENKDIEGFKPDYFHYIKKQLAVPVTELINVKYPRKIMVYENLDDAIKKGLEKLDDYQLQQLSRTRVFLKNVEGSERTYRYKGLAAKIEYVLASTKREGKLEIDSDDNKKLIGLCNKWKSRYILDRVYAQYGNRKRPKRGPTYVGDRLSASCKVILKCPIRGRDKDEIGKVVDRKDKANQCVFDILMEEKPYEVIKDIPRNAITTFYYKDGKVMKDILTARITYRQVVDHLNKLFSTHVYFMEEED